MTGKTHAICGAIAMVGTTIATHNSLQIGGANYIPALGLLTVVTGSYLPDIDLPQSKMGHRFRFISTHLKHRGITHTLLFPALLALLMLWVQRASVMIVPDLLLGLNVGWSAHIVADLFNRKGVPLFWPLTNKHVHIACFLTSSWQEVVFIILWLGGTATWVYFLLR